MKFAKIFDLENGEQILVVMQYDDEQNTHDLVVSTNIEGTKLDLTFSFESEEDLESYFNNLNTEYAVKFRAAMIEALNNND